MILRFKKPDEYEKMISSFEVNDNVMAYLIPYKMEDGIESLLIHFSVQVGESMNLNTLPEINYEMPFNSRFDSFEWKIDHWDTETAEGDYYLIFLYE